MWKPRGACLLIDQLSKVPVNLVGLQEVRWADSGELNLEDYTLPWSGPSTDSPRQAGVALAMDRWTEKASFHGIRLILTASATVLHEMVYYLSCFFCKVSK